jgi:PRTRC genetic system protein B
VVHAKNWYVFALKASERPDMDTPLLHSPHFNVHADANICAGNVPLPSTPTASAISEYEEAFHRSHFTHVHRTGVVKYKGGATALWRDQLRNPDSATMLAALVPAKKTLKSAIEQIAKNHRSAH